MIVALDSGHGTLEKQAAFCERAGNRGGDHVVLTDNLDELVVVLEERTGEKARLVGAVDVVRDYEKCRLAIPEKGPIWFPDREREKLEAQAHAGGNILFRVEGYREFIERVRKLAGSPSLGAMFRDVLDDVLAYDRGCREGDAGAVEFLELIDRHDEARAQLEEGAKQAGLRAWEVVDYGQWLEMTERLVRNGAAIVDEMGELAGDAGDRIVCRVQGLAALLRQDEDEWQASGR